MKKTIVIEILLSFILSILILFAFLEFRGIYYNFQAIKYLESMGQEYIDFSDSTRQFAIYGSLAVLASLATIAVMVLIAIKDFPVFKPLVDKFNAKRAAHKEQREAIKAEQAEAAKQARIEQLQAELDELKKDE